MITERVQAILKSVSQRVEKLIPSGRFYVVFYDSQKGELSFPLVRDGKNLSTWDSRPCQSDSILPDLVVSKAKSLLYENDLVSRYENGEICYWPDEKNVPYSWLGVPLIAGDQTLGSVVVESWQKTYSFNKNDESTLTAVARQASIAIENARLYEQLDRKVENLRILNEAGRQLANGLVKQESEILNLAIQSATKLRLDTQNMYIAFYDPDINKPDIPDEIFGTIRIGAVRNLEQKSPMKNRVAQKGLTEYVIRTKKSFNPSDVQQAYEEYAPDSLQKSKSPRPRSWLGVPIFLGDQVRGVIVLRNYEVEHIYTDDDREIIEILSGQVAAELNRLHMDQREKEMQEERNAAENMAIMSLTAAEFAHKMNNLAGTIPVRIDMAKSLLDEDNPRNTKIIEYLEKIRKEADVILLAAKEIRESSERRAPEDVDVHQLLEIAIARVNNAHQNIQNRAEIVRIFSNKLCLIQVERNTFLDTLTSIIKNGVEAIEDEGTVTIKTGLTKRGAKEYLEIQVSDTGKGISSSELPKIFDLFYTTKGGKGLGFGLWRDKTFIKRMGGEIEVESEVGKGSVFTIHIPVGANS